MKWIKRGLWTAAWGVWVWCGFGLARELPRNFGPIESDAPFKPIGERWSWITYDPDESAIIEEWTWNLTPWLQALSGIEFSTWKVIDNKTFAFRYRTWQKPWPRFENKDGTRKWCADDEGNLYRLPPPPNWDLAIICQTILALPLIFLWSLLRWRRNRRLRLASVQ